MPSDPSSPDSKAARRVLRQAGRMPAPWTKFIAHVACGYTPESVVNESGTAYGEHGRLLFQKITEDYDTSEL